MSEPMRLAPPSVAWWSAAIWLAAFFAVLAVLFPLMPLAAGACLLLALWAGFPTYSRLLRLPESVRVTRWWLGASLLSLLALLFDFLMSAMPRPRFSDYFPDERVSPLQQFITENSWTLHWAASGTAALAAIAGVFIFHAVLKKVRAVLREPAVYATH